MILVTGGLGMIGAHTARALVDLGHSSPSRRPSSASYINAVLRGEEPRPLRADDGGDRCYAPDAGRAIALLMTERQTVGIRLTGASTTLPHRPRSGEPEVL